MIHARFRVPRLLLVLLFGCAIGGFAAPMSAHAATTWHVTTCLNGMSGSLDTILTSDVQTGDSVVFDHDCTGANTITPLDTLPTNADVSIDGTGKQVDIDGSNFSNSGDSLFFVPDGVTLTLTRLGVIQNLDATAPVENDGTLHVFDSTFSDSNGFFAGAILNQGTLTVSGSTFTNNTGFFAGAIENESLEIDCGSDCLSSVSPATSRAHERSGNMTVHSVRPHSLPPPIPGDPDATIVNSTFTGNSAFNGTQAVDQESTAPVTIVSSTFSGNGTTGFVLFSGPTIEDNGPVIMTNDIVANSVNADNCGGVVSSSLIVDDGYNLEDDAADTCGFSPASNDTVGQDPLLDPLGLQDNGGPTDTIALTANSPAIDTGGCTISDPNVTIPNVDQRGVSRPQGTACDIGAYEYPQNFLIIYLSLPAPWTSAALSHIFNNGTPLGTVTVPNPLKAAPPASINLTADQVILATTASQRTYFFVQFQPVPPTTLTGSFTTYAIYTTIEQQVSLGYPSQFLGTNAVKQTTRNKLLGDWENAEHAILQPAGSTVPKLTAVKTFACDVSGFQTTHKITAPLASTLLTYAGQTYTALGGTFTAPLC